MSAMKNTFLLGVLCYAAHFVCSRCENSEDANTGWVPSLAFVNNESSVDSKLWDSYRENEVEENAKISPRALLNNFGSNDVFDFERNQLKATPFYHPTSTKDSSNYPYSQINTRPNYVSQAAPPSSSSGSYQSVQSLTPYQTLQAPIVSPAYAQGQGQGYYYPSPAPAPAPGLSNQYLPPSTPSSQYLPPISVPPTQYLSPPQNQVEVFEAFTIANQTTDPLEINNINLLYVQPGKCSNSIQVSRIRDVEVKTAGYKYHADVQKGICVLMLYAHDEANKLAVSLQATQGSVDLIPTDSWLQSNVKMYALQAGDIQPVLTTSNFGPGSPALILTKSNIVLLSFFIDRAVDFFVDISTYQSQYC